MSAAERYEELRLDFLEHAAEYQFERQLFVYADVEREAKSFFGRGNPNSPCMVRLPSSSERFCKVLLNDWDVDRPSINEFKRLGALVWILLPTSIKQTVKQMTEDPCQVFNEKLHAYWVWILMSNDILGEAGTIAETMHYMEPFVGSALLIENWGLNTDSPQLPCWLSERLAQSETPPNTRKRAGRKKADYESVQRDAQLANDWKNARDRGACKVDFARDNNMGLKDFDRLLNRDAARKRR